MSCPSPVTPTDALIGLTAPSATAGVIPVYGTSNSGCTVLPPNYKSIIGNTPSGLTRDSDTGLFSKSDISNQIISKLTVCRIPSRFTSADISACVLNDATFIAGVSG